MSLNFLSLGICFDSHYFLSGHRINVYFDVERMFKVNIYSMLTQNFMTIKTGQKGEKGLKTPHGCPERGSIPSRFWKSDLGIIMVTT